MKPRQWKFQKINSKHAKRLMGQFCSLNTPLLLLAKPPTCVSALYAKDKTSIQKRCSLQIRKASRLSIPSSTAPNVWIITSLTTAVPSELHSSTLEKHLVLSYHRHPSTYSDYNQHAAPHHSISIYHHAMNPMKSLSTSHWTQPISMLSTYQHQNSEYGST